MKTRLILSTLVAAFIISNVGTAFSADLKLAFVDLRRALNETTEGKKAMDKLAKLKSKLQVKIEKEEKKIMEMKEGLEKQQKQGILTKDALQKKAEEYYQAVQELQQSYMRYQKELSAKEADLTQDILLKMQKIIEEMGKAEGYTMIYDRSSGAVVWAPSHLDLTDQLIQKYNGKYKSKKK